jgi:RNA polymerase sigma factor (sigma-70 family)
MATAPMDVVIRHLRRTLRQDGAGRTDGQLLASFIEQKDEAAFEALVRRHGPMVFGVCRRIVGNYHDAEDAFQATFLVLARKALSVRPREMVAHWLHGVALRTALKSKAMAAKRYRREKAVAEMPEPEAAPPDQGQDLHPRIDQALNHLPAKYRLPILLCDLEGKAIKEAAQQLGWPQGTLAGRLARGRKLLAKRLGNRGAVLSAGSLVAVVSQTKASAGVPTSLLSTTVKAAAMVAAGQAAVAGVVPADVAVLTEGVLESMLLTKLKVAMMLMVAVMVIGASSLLRWTAAAQDAKPAPQRQGAVVAHTSPAPQEREQKGNDQPKTQENQAIEGVWTLVSGASDGKALKVEKDSVQLVVSHEFWIWKERGKDRAFTYRIDIKQNPKQIDLTAQNIKGLEGFVLRCIYEIDGDTLKVCESVGKRPMTFSAKTGSGNTQFIYERSNVKNMKADAKKDQKQKDQNQISAPLKRDARTVADGGAKHAAAKTDLDRLQGVWSVLSIESGGQRSKSEKAVFMVDGKRACLQGRDGEMQGGLYLEPASKPKSYDLAMSTRTIEGIYSLHGDTLRLCYAMGLESKRPGAFITKRGTQQVLIVLKRIHGPEVFPFRLADGTRAFPTLIEKAKTTPPQIAPTPKVNERNYDFGLTAPAANNMTVKVGTILVVGNTKTKTSAILKLIPFRPGDVLDYQALRTAEKNLARFNPTITVLDGGKKADFKDIQVTVREK